MNTQLQVKDFAASAANTWCPGCGNFGIEIAAKKAMLELCQEEKVKKENLVMVSGIGCHGKIADYLNINSFYSLHGRTLAPAQGIKLANPELTVICHAGDGDGYGEGLEHLIFAAKRNVNITIVIHDNRIYALTTGQFSPTSPFSFKGKSTPQGSLENPLNPLELMITSGATFVARAFAADSEFLRELIKRAALHKGFAFIDVLQPCFTFFNTYEFYRQRVYRLENHPVDNKEEALKRAREWDYSQNEAAKIPIGVFYEMERPTYDELVEQGLAAAG